MNVQVTQEQKDTIIATLKSKREGFASKLRLINLFAFGVYLLLTIFGCAVKVGDTSLSYWNIFQVSDGVKSVNKDLVGSFSFLSVLIVLMLIVLVAGLVLNVLWRDWDDGKHNKIKHIATYALFALHIIQLFVIFSMNSATWSLVLPGWTFWIHGIIAWIVAAVNLIVIVYDIQISKYQLLPTA